MSNALDIKTAPEVASSVSQNQNSVAQFSSGRNQPFIPHIPLYLRKGVIKSNIITSSKSEGSIETTTLIGLTGETRSKPNERNLPTGKNPQNIS